MPIFEDEFSLTLRETAEASPPTSVQLLAIGAAQRGRRRLRRRTVVGSAAAMAAVACLGVLTLQLRPRAEGVNPGTAGTTANPTTVTATTTADITFTRRLRPMRGTRRR